MPSPPTTQPEMIDKAPGCQMLLNCGNKSVTLKDNRLQQQTSPLVSEEIGQEFSEVYKIAMTKKICACERKEVLTEGMCMSVYMCV